MLQELHGSVDLAADVLPHGSSGLVHVVALTGGDPAKLTLRLQLKQIHSLITNAVDSAVPVVPSLGAASSVTPLPLPRAVSVNQQPILIAPASTVARRLLAELVRGTAASTVLAQSLLLFFAAYLLGSYLGLTRLGIGLLLLIAGLKTFTGVQRQISMVNTPRLDETLFDQSRSPARTGSVICVPPEVLPAWVQHPDVEKTEWINDMLDTLWPHVGKAATALVMAQVDTKLQELQLKTASLSLPLLALGSKPPIIKGVRHYSNRQQGNQIILDIFVRLGGDLRVVAEARLGSLAARVVLSDVVFDGVLRVVFAPLVLVYPCFSSVSISFAESPHIDFSLSVLGLPLMSLPGAVLAVNAVRRMLVDPLLTWPNRITIPILDFDKCKQVCCTSQHCCYLVACVPIPL